MIASAAQEVQAALGLYTFGIGPILWIKMWFWKMDTWSDLTLERSEVKLQTAMSFYSFKPVPRVLFLLFFFYFLF